jgi:hypothetical protein
LADICNQLLDFYDEIERQNAVAAQAAVSETSEQRPACSSSQIVGASPVATLPELKVERLSAFFVSPPKRMLPQLWLWISLFFAGKSSVHLLNFVWELSQFLAAIRDSD